MELLGDARSTRSNCVRRSAGVFILVCGPFVAAQNVRAQQGVITGTVRDTETLQPISEAQVYVPETGLGTRTGIDGTFRLTGVPIGQITLSVRLIGYREAFQIITVSDDQILTADFEIQQIALRIQDLVITGVVAATPQVKLPFSVERIGAQDLPVPASDVASLLSAKAPGVRVVSGSGQPGQAGDIVLRSPNSIDALGRSRSPLFVIDGVIQSGSASLSDIGTLDIDRVEIVKGAAAASLYGSRAQNGVIQITTKRGTSLEPNTSDFLLRAEYGFSELAHTIDRSQNHPWAMNAAGTKFIDTFGNEIDFADFGRNGNGSPVLNGGAAETSFRDGIHPGPVFDQYERFFDPGETYDVYGALTGHFDDSGYRVSFEQFREKGIVSCGTDCQNPIQPELKVEDEGYERQNARLNFDGQIDELEIAASAFYSRSVQDRSAATGGIFERLGNASVAIDLTQPDEDGLPSTELFRVAGEANPLYLLAITDARQNRVRTMGSLDLSWSPARWLSVSANASYDRTDTDAHEALPRDERSAGGAGTTSGSLRKSNITDEAVNSSVTVSLSEAFLDGDLVARGRLRYVAENQDFTSNGVFGTRFSVDDVPNFGAIIGETDGENAARQIKAAGYFGIAGLDYKGRYILDGLVRRDGSSLFGPDDRWHTYFRASAAWRPSQEDWWNVDPVDELKLRLSHGTAGGRPNFESQYETYGVQAGAIFPIAQGNRNLRPEITRETEVGLNAVILGNLGIDYTYAWGRTDDQLLLVPQPAFSGFSHRWQNAGEIEYRSYELSLRLVAIDNSEAGLQFRLNWDRSQHEISRLGIPPFSQRDGAYIVSVGRSLGEVWGTRWATACSDLTPVGVGAANCSSLFQVNDEGYLVFVGEESSFTEGKSRDLWGTTGVASGSTGDINYKWGHRIPVEDKSPACLHQRAEAGDPSDAAGACPLEHFLPIGNHIPDWNGALATRLRFKGLSVSLLLDASVGHELYNFTRQAADDQILDQAGKPDELKKPVSYYTASATSTPVNVGKAQFVEPGDWLKIRELAIGYSLPSSTVERWFGGGVSRVTFNLIGRNLITFTGYRGFDPEVGESGFEFQSAVLGGSDVPSYPNFRTITASVEIVF